MGTGTRDCPQPRWQRPWRRRFPLRSVSICPGPTGLPDCAGRYLCPARHGGGQSHHWPRPRAARFHPQGGC
eukprot:9902284-Lingulodinium_polyedra.AAC.1